MDTSHNGDSTPSHHSLSESKPGEYNPIPRIDLDLWAHKISIAVHWTILFISSCIVPIVFYFTLRYSAHLPLSTVLAVTTAIFGAVTLFSLLKRLWLLLKTSSTCRPLGASRASLDFFQWNFMLSFACTTAIIVAGNVTLNIRVVAMGLPVIFLSVGSQLLLTAWLSATRSPSPFRLSSVAKGELVRSGVYAIAEDIVAVDGGQGQDYRRQLQSRYLASSEIRNLCFKLDVFWGISGLMVGAICLGLIFGLRNANVAYLLGWVIPWGFAIFGTFVTYVVTIRALKNETARG